MTGSTPAAWRWLHEAAERGVERGKVSPAAGWKADVVGNVWSLCHLGLLGQQTTHRPGGQREEKGWKNLQNMVPLSAKFHKKEMASGQSQQAGAAGAAAGLGSALCLWPAMEAGVISSSAGLSPGCRHCKRVQS